ncbi:MAG: hypothetical protein JNJ89_18590 [Rubrivivax sp.]|nr:hypothetical protein [Rubrivivax sp.]
MADPQAALLTQLRNIQAKTGNTIAALHAALESTGLATKAKKGLAIEEVVPSIGQPCAHMVAAVGTRELVIGGAGSATRQWA